MDTMPFDDDPLWWNDLTNFASDALVKVLAENPDVLVWADVDRMARQEMKNRQYGNYKKWGQND